MISHIACHSAFGDDMAPRTRGGCCAAAPRADEPRESTRASASAETTGNGDGHERALARKFTRLGTKMKSAPVVLTSTRTRGDGERSEGDANGGARKSASKRWRAAKTKMRVVRRMTTTTSERLAALLKEKIEYELASESERRERVESDKGALDARLTRLGMRRVAMEGDGNCQFRSIAHNVFKDQERYAEVRALATAHIEERMEDFQIYFENARAFRVWLVGMKRDRTGATSSRCERRLTRSACACTSCNRRNRTGICSTNRKNKRRNVRRSSVTCLPCITTLSPKGDWRYTYVCELLYRVVRGNASIFE